MIFDEFHFLRPQWFWVVPVLFLIAIVWFRKSLSKRSWAKVCDDQLLPYIIEENIDRSSRLPWIYFFIAMILAVIAVAGPTWKRLPLPVYKNDAALVVVLDLSKSMDAEDVKPNRLSRARYKISDILEQRKDGTTALVVFSNEAYTVAPLTDDNATILSQLSALDTSIMPAQGSNTSIALKRAVELLKQSGNRVGNILLITDSAEKNALKVAEELKKQGYRLYILGIGSEEGAPIPASRGGFVKDSGGNIVVSKLKVGGLNALARAGGGFYTTLSVDDHDIRSILDAFDPINDISGDESNTLHADQWIEEGPWLFVLILPIAALAFRRGYLFLAITLIMPFPDPVFAWQWNDLWQTRDQQAYEAYQRGDHSQAAELFENPGWKAASEYSSGQYQKTIETLNDVNSKTTAYNRGNALARAGQFPESLKAFDQALELDPDNEDARYNRDLVQKLLDQQKSKNQSSDNDEASEEEKDSQQNRESGKNNDAQQEDQPESSDKANESEKSKNDNPSDLDDSSQESQASGSENMKEENGDPEQQEIQQGAESADVKEQATQPKEEPQGDEKEQRSPTESAKLDSEQQQVQVDEQWLRRIPDDPAGLLRRKFKYQYKKRGARQLSRGENW